MSKQPDKTFASLDFEDQHSKICTCTRNHVPEAAILLIARCTEHLVKAIASEKLGVRDPSVRLADCTELLRQANLMPVSVSYWVTTLRRYGNQIRHTPHIPTTPDMVQAEILYKRVLEWTIEQTQRQDLLSGLDDQSDFEIDLFKKLIDSIEAFERDYMYNTAGTKELTIAAVASSAVAAGALCEILLNRGQNETALSIAQSAQQQYPEDVRLNQLYALAISRAGQDEVARTIIEAVIAKGHRDEETLGIAAGIYKRLGLKNDDTSLLELSHRYYLEVWRNTNPKLFYQGVNAAATALYIRQGNLSRSIAQSVIAATSKRMNQHASSLEISNKLSIWDTLSYAEALFLNGSIRKSIDIYKSIFAEHEMNAGITETAKRQLAVNARYMQMDLEVIFRNKRAPNPSSRTIFVLGHRNWSPDDRTVDCIRKALSALKADHESLCIISNLAAGADQILANLAMEFDQSATLTACLPLEIDNLHRTMPLDTDRAEFRKLLSRASNLVITPPSEADVRNNDLYSRAGKWAANRCDAALAVWDGEPAQGPGGTADIIAYLKSKKRNVHWLCTKTNSFKVL